MVHHCMQHTPANKIGCNFIFIPPYCFDSLPTGHRDWREAVRAFEVLYSVLTYEEKKKAEEKGKEDEV